MKKNKALYMWSALAALAIAGAVFDYQWDKRLQERKSIEERVLQLEAGKITELELTLENPSTVTKDSVPVMTNKLQFVKSNEKWMLKAPVEEPADQNAVDSYIEWVVNEKASQVKAPEPIHWSTYGLDKPRGAIQLKDDQGRAYRINVSSRKNFEGDAYLRKDGEEKVLLANAMWFSNIEKTLIDFRDKRILKVPVSQIFRFHLKGGKESLAFEKKDGAWILTAKPTWRLDQNRVRELLAVLTGPMVIEFKREGAIQSTDLKEFNLEKPKASVEVEVAEGLTWIAEISELKDGHFFLHVNDPSAIVTVNSDEGTKLTKNFADDFRDRKAPFNLSREKLKSLELSKASASFKAEKDQTQWQVKEKAETAKVEGQQISGLIERVRNLEVSEFVPTAKDVGETQAATHLVLKDDAGATLFSLSLGALTKIKSANGVERNVVLAKTNLTDEVISIDKDQVEALGLGALLGETPAQTQLKPGVESPGSKPVEGQK